MHGSQRSKLILTLAFAGLALQASNGFAEGGVKRAEHAEHLVGVGVGGAKSGPERVALVELFSSEGCDSCPPADIWLSGLKDQEQLWKKFVPIAFQVDYWDGLGWKDRLASQEFTERQRAHARELGTDQIYTPEFYLNGLEWRSWRGANRPNVPSEHEDAGLLSVDDVSDGEKFVVRYVPPAAHSKKMWQLHFATLGMGIKDEVTKGENRGRTLAHDFVALQLLSKTAQVVNGVATAQFEISTARDKMLPPINGTLNGRLNGQRAIAVWVTEPSQLRPVQATGGVLNLAIKTSKVKVVKQ